MLRSEAKFQSWIMRDLQLAGAVVFNVHGSAFQSSGWPDLLVFHGKLPGGCCGLELKIQGGTTRTNQVVKLRKLNDRRFRGFFLRHWKDGDLTFEIQRHGDDKPRQILLVKNWESSCKETDIGGRRVRGHVVLDAVNEAWEVEYGDESAQ